MRNNIKIESYALLAASRRSSSSSQHTHKKQMSALLPLSAIVLGFEFAFIGITYYNRAIERSDALALAAGPFVQTLWAIWVVQSGRRQQFFLRKSILRSFPIVWLPMIPVIILMTAFSVRWDAVIRMVDHIPRTVFVGLQALRVLAVGSLIKWKMGLFPTAFAWGTAFPDMLFGVSAIFLLIFQNHEEYPFSAFFLFVWNVMGFSIIIPFGATLLQLGMSPTKLYESRVSNDVVFEYPMVLGPAVVVPTLLSWNAIVIAWALSQMK